MRKGYNSDWQWKQWGYEVKACREAIRRGDLAGATQRLEQAEQIAGQLEFEFDQAVGITYVEPQDR